MMMMMMMVRVRVRVWAMPTHVCLLCCSQQLRSSGGGSIGCPPRPLLCPHRTVLKRWAGCYVHGICMCAYVYVGHVCV